MTTLQSTDPQSSVANFVQKAFEIINNKQNSSMIEWSSNGKQFTIKDIEQFQQIILPKYFRHRNINSFIRQLNMYGFHKSRKEPTKNIFSHPFFQKDKKELLVQVKRKIKNDQILIETPRKNQVLDNIRTAQTKNQIKRFEKSTPQILFSPQPQIQFQRSKQKQSQQIKSQNSIVIKSQSNMQKDLQSPYKNFNFMISRSFILDINPQTCLKLRQNRSFIAQEEQDQDDKLSIADQINRQRKRFNNRTQGISIVKTSNFLSEFDI